LAVGVVTVLLATALPARAQDGVPPAPPPWEITGTSSITAIVEPAPQHRLEYRRFQKNGRLLARAGFSYLSRGDYYTNPGITVEASYYPAEMVALDVVSATVFFSQLGATADALRRQTGLLPDAQRPRFRLMSGARFAFAYGKLLIEELDAVIHLDANITAHVGGLFTDQTLNAAGDLGLAFQALVADRMVLAVEATYFISYEQRSASSVASGPMGTIALGFLF
jgi:hypothetical protein